MAQQTPVRRQDDARQVDELRGALSLLAFSLWLQVIFLGFGLRLMASVARVLSHTLINGVVWRSMASLVNRWLWVFFE